MKKLCDILFCIMIIFAILPSSQSSVTATDSVTDGFDFDNVNAVIEKINKIGNVTIHSGEKIKDARITYDELEDSDMYKENQRLKAEVNMLRSSKSWKITKPLRELRSLFRRK